MGAYADAKELRDVLTAEYERDELDSTLHRPNLARRIERIEENLAQAELVADVMLTKMEEMGLLKGHGWIQKEIE